RHTRFSRDWSSDVCSSDLICIRRLRHPEGASVESLVEEAQTGPVEEEDLQGRPPLPEEEEERAAPRIATEPIRDEPGETIEAPRSEERRVGKGGRSRGTRE